MPETHATPAAVVPLSAGDLRADCSRCFALCCVLLPYQRAAGCGADKAGGTPCHHLTASDRCAIHDQLDARGWPGCAIFDCFGAGQQVAQVTYAGRSWRDPDVDRGEMAAVLSALRLVQEMLAHLDQAGRRRPDLADPALISRLLHWRDATPAVILEGDLDAIREEVGDHLRTVSLAIRRPTRPAAGAGARPDLSGRDLRAEDLRAADLRGALLLGADLREVDLTDADLLGADLRGADLRGTQARDALFLTRPQVAAARTDDATTVPFDNRTPPA